MSLDRITLYLGLFFLGVSSLGFNPHELTPWITPKINLAFIGLAILFLKEILSVRQLNFKIVKEISPTSFILLASCLFFIFQRIFINYPWGETILLIAVLLSSGLTNLFKEEEIKSNDEVVLMHFLNGIFFLQAMATIIQFLFFEHFHFTMMGSSLKWRSLGFIGNPNQLALYLSLYYFRPTQFWWHSKYGKGLTAVVSLAMLLTFSRGVYLALFISFLFSLKFALKFSFKNNIKWASMAGTLIILIIFVMEFFWQKTGFLNNDSISGRLQSFKSFVNDYTFNVQDFLIGTGRFELNAPIHNQYIYLFNSVGMIGLLFYLLLLTSFIKKNPPLVLMIAVFSMYDLPLLNPAFIFGIILYFLYLPAFSTIQLKSCDDTLPPRTNCNQLDK